VRSAARSPSVTPVNAAGISLTTTRWTIEVFAVAGFVLGFPEVACDVLVEVAAASTKPCDDAGCGCGSGDVAAAVRDGGCAFQLSGSGEDVATLFAGRKLPTKAMTVFKSDDALALAAPAVSPSAEDVVLPSEANALLAASGIA
jgi:hypothetical protein